MIRRAEEFYDNITVKNIRIKLVFSDAKNGTMLHEEGMCVLNLEHDGDKVKRIFESDDITTAYFAMCSELSEEIAKRGIPPYINRWKWAENDYNFQVSKWQRLIDAGEIKVELRGEEFTTNEKRIHRLRY